MQNSHLNPKVISYKAMAAEGNAQINTGAGLSHPV